MPHLYACTLELLKKIPIHSHKVYGDVKWNVKLQEFYGIN